MLRVGLTGGLASGKSFVGKTLATFGCHLIDADILGHTVLARGGAAFDAVLAEFGPGILDEQGAISRPVLAHQVFSNPERLAKLNGIVHPHVIALEEHLLQEIAAKNPSGIAVVEAAILIETGSYRRFDRLILVTCAEEQQIERAMARHQYTLEEAQARLSHQMPVAEKRRYADYVIDTSGLKENTIEQTRAVYESLRSIQL
jgi:dephospho-CoA kinase